MVLALKVPMARIFSPRCGIAPGLPSYVLSLRFRGIYGTTIIICCM